MPSGDVQQLSAILRRERERAGLTVRELAEAAGLVASTVSRLETGLVAEPRPSHLQALARALGIEVEELYVPVGYANVGAWPEFRTYLRQRYQLSDEAASRMEGYLKTIKTNEDPKEVPHDHDNRDQAP
jgi:putative transcriptional regulator